MSGERIKPRKLVLAALDLGDGTATSRCEATRLSLAAVVARGERRYRNVTRCHHARSGREKCLLQSSANKGSPVIIGTVGG